MDIQQLNELRPPTLQQCSVSCRAFWKTIEGQYVSATGLYIGKVLVASYSYNGLRSKDAKKETYVVSSSMPGIKRDLGKYETEEECQTRCYEVAETFLKMLRHGS